MTTGHKVCWYAAIIGAIHCFLLAFVTTPVTCATDGCTNWTTAAISMTATSWLASVYFTFILAKVLSSKPSAEVRNPAWWCFFWSNLTLIVRVFDTLMIVGIVHIPAIYHTPGKATMIANIFSEVIFGTLFNSLASYGSGVLLFCPQDTHAAAVEAGTRGGTRVAALRR